MPKKTRESEFAHKQQRYLVADALARPPILPFALTDNKDKSADDPLTDHERAFMNAYISSGFNARQACLDTKFDLNKTTFLLRDQRFILELNRIQKKSEDLAGINFSWKLKKLAEIVTQAIDYQTQLNTFHPGVAKVAVDAISEMNKMQGDYAPVKVDNRHLIMTVDKILEAKNVYQKKEYDDA